MSINWGYRCVSHEPPLDSEYWLNHGDDVLADVYERVRDGSWPRDEYGDASPVRYRGQDFDVVWWLDQHAQCHVVLSNEYSEAREIWLPRVISEGSTL